MEYISHYLHQLTNNSHNQTEACTNPQPNTCIFYPLCLESRYHCGPAGYPLRYGYKYCIKFQEERNKLSSAGQKWMIDVMLCLQEKLVPEATETTNITSCKELEDYAFSTHPQCYVDSGFCTLSPVDWAAVIEILSLETLFESLDILVATAETAGECAEFYIWAFENAIF